MKTWKLTLEYDGSKYRGWQEQRNARTVMGELRQAAEDVFGGKVDLHGSGRTDAGVHAGGQVAHLRAPALPLLDPGRILRELNDRLPAEIAVIAVEFDSVTSFLSLRSLNDLIVVLSARTWMESPEE